MNDRTPQENYLFTGGNRPWAPTVLRLDGIPWWSHGPLWSLLGDSSAACLTKACHFSREADCRAGDSASRTSATWARWPSKEATKDPAAEGQCAKSRVSS
eukprot:1601601-Amphidinium_carterae.1